MVTLALDGLVAYRDQYELIYRHTAERPNDTWQADHAELDILITDASGRPERPWLTTIIDDKQKHRLSSVFAADNHAARLMCWQFYQDTIAAYACPPVRGQETHGQTHRHSGRDDP